MARTLAGDYPFFPDLDRSDYVLILGANPWESNGSLATAADFLRTLKSLLEDPGMMLV